MRTYPPPLDGLPEYSFGRLIFYDSTSDDNCRWVVYDGDKKVRCPDRMTALRYCAEKAGSVDDELVTLLLVVNDELRRCWQHLDRVAARLPAEERLEAGLTAVELRKQFDRLDRLISQHIKK